MAEAAGTPALPGVVAIICGSRDGEGFLRVTHPQLLRMHRGEWSARALSDFHQRIARLYLVLIGRKDGFDGEAEDWCWTNEVMFFGAPARYNTGEKKGRVEAVIRNSRLLKWLLRTAEITGKPPVCLAMPGEDGTADMVSKCVRKELPVWRCSVDNETGWRWDRG